MRFFSLAAPVLTAFAALAAASTQAHPNPVLYPVYGTPLHTGQTVTIKWTPTTPGTVTLRLRSGIPQDLDEGTVLVSSAPNSGRYTFRIPDSTQYSAYYSVEIIDDEDPSNINFSAPFVINTDATAPTTTAPHPGTHTAHHDKGHRQGHHKGGKSQQPHVKLGASPTRAKLAGVTYVPAMAAGLDFSRGMAAVAAVGVGVAAVL